MDLLEPYVIPVVDEMMDDVDSGRASTLAHVPETITRLLKGLNEVACLVPESFYEVCAMIKPLVPEEVTPLCESIIVHIFVSCLYGVITKLESVFRYIHVCIYQNTSTTITFSPGHGNWQEKN